MYIHGQPEFFISTIPSNSMETSSPAFSLVLALLIGVLGLTSIGVYLSFGPPSKKLIDPWEADDD